jgi:hypothetical protein
VPDLDLLRTLAPPIEPVPPRVARPRRRRRRPLLLTAPIAAALILALLLTQDRQTFAAAAVKAAEASPRLLVDGWKVTRVDEWQAETGEMTFERDGRTLELHWGEERTVKDGMVRAGTATVAGRRATIVRYSDAPKDFTAIWGTVYARELGVDLAEFKRTLGAIHQVGAEEWLRALPQSAVTPRAQDDTIAAMLKDIPIPPGFKAPTGSDATRDRYQLGAAVAGAVACGWIERWLAGDPKAAAALASSRDWPLLRRMDAEGDYPEVVWQYADAVNGKSAVPGGKLGLTVDGTYKDALGC